MPAYPIRCDHPPCTAAAQFKIAAEWSDGQTRELKTYALCCAPCLQECFASAQARHASCRLALGEDLAPPGIYELAHGARDKQLIHRTDLEASLLL